MQWWAAETAPCAAMHRACSCRTPVLRYEGALCVFVSEYIVCVSCAYVTAPCGATRPACWCRIPVLRYMVFCVCVCQQEYTCACVYVCVSLVCIRLLYVPQCMMMLKFSTEARAVCGLAATALSTQQAWPRVSAAKLFTLPAAAPHTHIHTKTHTQTHTQVIVDLQTVIKELLINYYRENNKVGGRLYTIWSVCVCLCVCACVCLCVLTCVYASVCVYVCCVV